MRCYSHCSHHNISKDKRCCDPKMCGNMNGYNNSVPCARTHFYIEDDLEVKEWDPHLNRPSDTVTSYAENSWLLCHTFEGCGVLGEGSSSKPCCHEKMCGDTTGNKTHPQNVSCDIQYWQVHGDISTKPCGRCFPDVDACCQPRLCHDVDGFGTPVTCAPEWVLAPAYFAHRCGTGQWNHSMLQLTPSNQNASNATYCGPPWGSPVNGDEATTDCCQRRICGNRDWNGTQVFCNDSQYRRQGYGQLWCGTECEHEGPFCCARKRCGHTDWEGTKVHCGSSYHYMYNESYYLKDNTITSSFVTPPVAGTTVKHGFYGKEAIDEFLCNHQECHEGSDVCCKPNTCNNTDGFGTRAQCTKQLQYYNPRYDAHVCGSTCNTDPPCCHEMTCGQAHDVEGHIHFACHEDEMVTYDVLCGDHCDRATCCRKIECSRVDRDNQTRWNPHGYRCPDGFVTDDEVKCVPNRNRDGTLKTAAERAATDICSDARCCIEKTCGNAGLEGLNTHTTGPAALPYSPCRGGSSPTEMHNKNCSINCGSYQCCTDPPDIQSDSPANVFGPDGPAYLSLPLKQVVLAKSSFVDAAIRDKTCQHNGTLEIQILEHPARFFTDIVDTCSDNEGPGATLSQRVMASKISQCKDQFFSTFQDISSQLLIAVSQNCRHVELYMGRVVLGDCFKPMLGKVGGTCIGSNATSSGRLVFPKIKKITHQWTVISIQVVTNLQCTTGGGGRCLFFQCWHDMCFVLWYKIV